MNKSLRSSDWILVLSLLAIMGSLVLVSKVNAYRSSSLIELQQEAPEMILVKIEGAVGRPGEYRVAEGTMLRDVLKKARPKPWANLQKFPEHLLIEAPATFEVEELSEIVVMVSGEVLEPGKIVMPAKSRVCDLRSKVSLTQDADKGFFRRRRVLKNGEKIDVPKKTVE